MNQFQFKFNKKDTYLTPCYAVTPILEYIPKGSVVWCPFDMPDSNYVKVLTEHGCKVIATHIDMDGDFFKVDIPECDYIISNPPYSIKTQIFKKLYEIGKPFAMLINLQGLFDSKERFELFKNNRVEIMFLNPRVNYINESGATDSVPFQSCYICSGILDNQLGFKSIERNDI